MKELKKLNKKEKEFMKRKDTLKLDVIINRTQFLSDDIAELEELMSDNGITVVAINSRRYRVATSVTNSELPKKTEYANPLYTLIEEILMDTNLPWDFS